MQIHVINIQLRIEARDDISRADLMSDLRRQVAALGEQAPYRSIHGSGWWTNSNSAVAALNYENIGEQLAYEAEMRAERVASLEAAGEPVDYSGYDEDGKPMYRNTADGPQCARCGEMNGEHEARCPNAEDPDCE
jgi:hypothetical protein